MKGGIKINGAWLYAQEENLIIDRAIQLDVGRCACLNKTWRWERRNKGKKRKGEEHKVTLMLRLWRLIYVK